MIIIIIIIIAYYVQCILVENSYVIIILKKYTGKNNQNVLTFNVFSVINIDQTVIHTVSVCNISQQYFTVRYFL